MTWSQLPLADMEYLRGQAKIIQILAEENGLERAHEFFFNEILQGYYSPMFDGLKEEVGHITYRLSDFLSQEARENMKIYPSSTGSIIEADGYRWDSLEDWRKSWKKYHPIIPDLFSQGKIEAQELLGLPETT